MLSERLSRIPLDNKADIKAEPEERLVKNINPYLIDGPDVFVEKRSKPLADLPSVVKGSQPTDGGALLVEPEDYEAVMADPIAAKYVRPFMGARELIHGLPRWCLWLVDASPREIRDSQVLSERVDEVRRFRLKSKKESTRSLARTPHLFGERRPALSPYVCIPSVVSERREYITARHLDQSVITSNLAFTAEDPDGFLFAIISSLMFMTWQRLVGGRLKSDLRFSNTLVWNTFPLPSPNAEVRDSIIRAGQHLANVRSSLTDDSLASVYSRTPLDVELQRAHNALDVTVDRLFGIDDPSTEQRERRLIQWYLKINR